MSHEIEAKVKVSALATITEKLKKLGADHLRDIKQADTYFMDSNNQLSLNDCGLRIRREIDDGSETAMVTFKGARTKSQYKSRPEYESGISDAAMGEKIFESLGYSKRITIQKKRSIWRIDDCLVCLDELPRLGCFVEIEGPDENIITEILAKLGLQNEPHISEGYASMMAHQLKSESIQE